MSRQLRTRLEQAQSRQKDLRDSLPSMSARGPLPEDLATIEQLRSEIVELETAKATAADRLALARADHEQVARQLLRLEPISTTGFAGIPVALICGFPLGLVLAWGWFGLAVSHQWPRLAAVVALGASTMVLLGGAWRTGRISGARGPR